jgi:hypothetical protein
MALYLNIEYAILVANINYISDDRTFSYSFFLKKYFLRGEEINLIRNQ